MVLRKPKLFGTTLPKIILCGSTSFSLILVFVVFLSTKLVLQKDILVLARIYSTRKSEFKSDFQNTIEVTLKLSQFKNNQQSVDLSFVKFADERKHTSCSSGLNMWTELRRGLQTQLKFSDYDNALVLLSSSSPMNGESRMAERGVGAKVRPSLRLMLLSCCCRESKRVWNWDSTDTKSHQSVINAGQLFSALLNDLLSSIAPHHHLLREIYEKWCLFSLLTHLNVIYVEHLVRRWVVLSDSTAFKTVTVSFWKLMW